MGERQISAQFYDLDNRNIVIEDIPFYKNYVNLGYKNVLELGCGTGRVSFELLTRDSFVDGIDNSISMINIFNNKKILLPTNLQSRINVLYANMSSFETNKTYSLIIAPFRSFQALCNQDDITNCLNKVQQHLDDDGIFIVNSFRPYKKFDASWVSNKFLQWERIDSLTGALVKKYHQGKKIDIGNQIIYPEYSYIVEYEDGTKKEFKENLSIKYYYYEQLKELLEKFNFKIEEEYGFYDKSSIIDNKELIFVCTKRKVKYS